MIAEKNKLFLWGFIYFLFINFVNAQPCKCNSKDAAKHSDEFCIVTGIVYDVSCLTNSKGNMICLNIGNKYPYQDLTVIVFEKYLSNFSKPLDILYKSKTVSIYGIIKIYKSKPVISIIRESDIEIKP